MRDHNPFADRTLSLDASVNPYVAALSAAQRDGSLPIAHGPDLRDARGTWRRRIATYHGRETPFTRLIVEVGCHKGVTLLEMAAAYPDIAFVGIDITFKRVFTTAERAKLLGLKNIYTVLANATALDQLFDEREIDGCLVFFPDPWVRKKKQAKNRLLTADFAAKLKYRLAAQGLLWLKTDQEPYYAMAAANLAHAGFARLDDAEYGIFGRDFSSTFEKRFAEQNLPTHGGRFRVCYN